MKKYPFLILGVMIILMAGVPGNLLAKVNGSTQAGVAAAVKGEVSAMTPSAKAAHPLKSGDKIFMGDKIETGAGGQLQILLLDQTVFTLGPLSTITVDEFVYDPNNAGDKAGMVKGIFRAVSGKVAAKKQESAAETEALLNGIDALDQKSQEAARGNAQRSAEATRH
ncbi:MAG: FecR domain-containing protein [Candidatus Omnitrophica bacterium]|nr:FecR domain-containing protein [Candidatus Omnitrophota bacterium]